MQVCEIMRHHPVVCFAEDSAEVAARTMAEQNTGVLPVVRKGSGGRLIGMVTDRDICLRVAAEGRHPRQVRVSECMSSAPICCGPRDDVRFAMLLMREHQLRRIPVVDSEHRIGGMLTLSNLLNSGFEAECLIETFRQTCSPVSQAMVVTK